MSASNRYEDFFNDIPLPFKYIYFPYPDKPPVPKHEYLKFYINEACTELVVRVYNRAGLPHVKDTWAWNCSWGRQFSSDEYNRCKSYQKITHFAGTYLLGKKAELDKRIKELRLVVGGFIDFYPETYVTPSEMRLALLAWKNHKLWISKPSSSSKGEGIKILNSATDSIPVNTVLQQYIEKPLLINRRKFDLRIYALVTSISPLRIYLHEYGLARFATHEYSENASTSDLMTHLTNYSINKANEEFIQSTSVKDMNDASSKWSLQHLYTHLESMGIDPKIITDQLDKITVTTVIAGVSMFRKVHQQNVKHRHTSQELYGLDILIDENLKCWLMEINISPSMDGSDSKMDFEIKTAVVTEMLNLARVVDTDPEKPTTAMAEYDVEWKRSIIQNSRKPDDAIWKSPSFADIVNVRDFIEEKERLKKFRRVFPKRSTVDTYMKCFKQPSYSDRSFAEWIKMCREERTAALSRGMDVYVKTLDEINERLTKKNAN